MTNDTTPAFAGTAEADSSITLLVGGVSKGTGTADSLGRYSISASTLPEGAHTVTIRARDRAGNESAASAGLVVRIDTTAPASPILSGSSPPSPGNSTLPRIAGTAEAGSTVSLYTDATCATAAAATGPAADFASPGLAAPVAANATTTFRPRATDAAGNRSSCSTASLTYVEDSIAPAAPSAPNLAPGSDSGDSSTDNLTNVASPTFSGTAEANTSVRLFVDGTQRAVTTASAVGAYSFTLALAAGPHTLSAKTIDAAGNLSTASGNVAVTIDLAAPDLPTFSGSDPGSPANGTTLTLKGAAEAGSTVRIFKGAGCVAPAAATAPAATFASTGITVTVTANTTTTFRATTTDAAGNASACSTDSLAYVEDSIAPATPSALDLAAADDTGASSTDNLTKAASLTFSGSAEAGSAVTVIVDGAAAAVVTASGAGSYSLALAGLAEGTHVVTAVARDSADNVSAASPGLTIRIDRTAPAVPAAPDLEAASDSGISSTDDLTKDTTPTVRGTAEPAASVQLVLDSVAGSTATADGAGNYSFTTAGLANGSHSLAASATDASGNKSSTSPALTITIDATAPGLPALVGSDPPSPANDNSPAIRGNAEASSTVLIYAGASCAGTPAATGTAADFSLLGLTVSVPPDSTTTFHATAEDRAGNPSSCSSSTVTY
ncbi:MAG: Ig-like domain-containing protein, partial [Chloroflexota bacterium]|nr:Ig-like domain-containing protein [Chloroflexota bacterium]